MKKLSLIFLIWNLIILPFTNGHPNSNKIIIKPKSFEKMKKLAEILSEGIPQVRIDFYDINGNIYFGEMTFSNIGVDLFHLFRMNGIIVWEV